MKIEVLRSRPVASQEPVKEEAVASDDEEESGHRKTRHMLNRMLPRAAEVR